MSRPPVTTPYDPYRVTASDEERYQSHYRGTSMQRQRGTSTRTMRQGEEDVAPQYTPVPINQPTGRSPPIPLNELPTPAPPGGLKKEESDNEEGEQESNEEDEPSGEPGPSREAEELKQEAYEEHIRKIKERQLAEAIQKDQERQSRIDARKGKERARSRSTSSESRKSKASTRRHRRVQVHQEDAPDYTYNQTYYDTASGGEGSTELDTINTDTFRGKTAEQQKALLAKYNAKIGTKITKGMIDQNLLDPDVVRAGVAEGARRTAERYGRQPSVPPLFGSTAPRRPRIQPQMFNPPRRPGGPGGGGGPGGPGGGLPQMQPGQYAWFQRGEWDPIQGRFHRSFHEGQTPLGNDLKLAKPPMFDGKQKGESAKIWIQHVERHFYLQPHLYLSDIRGITWATSYLQDAAAEWFLPYWNTVGTTNNPTATRWAAFVHAFMTQFGDPEAEARAEGKLKTLKQFKSVTEYINEFNMLQTKVQWDERALVFHFKNGLKADVLRFGGAVGWPDTLEGVKERAVKIDEGLMQARNQERQNNFQTTYRPPRPYQPPSRPQGNTAETSSTPMEGNAGATTYESKKRGPLPQAEKDRRRANGLCMYCGGPNHIAENCRIAKAKKKYQGNIAETYEPGERIDPFAGKGTNQ